MYLQQLLLHIFQKFNGQRSESAAYHLLRGKRSGQTIQDVGTFGLHPYFCVIPKLSKKIFDEAFNQLVENGWVFYDEKHMLQLTNRGEDILEKATTFHFNGWFYRGNEHIFFKRLSLIVQTLSHIYVEDWRFIPIQKEDEIQIWVKQFLKLHSYKNSALRIQLRDEIEISLKQLEIAEQSKQIMMLRLTGYKLTGWTWQQLASEFDCSELDVQLMLVEFLHSWLDFISAAREQFPLLDQLTENVRIEILLTDSTKKTAELYERGYSLEQISFMRHLKISTIEDHFVEMAMTNPHFPLLQFIHEEDILRVIQVLKESGSKRLKIIREQLPHLSYFQIRLVIAAKGGI
ncbi:helix-turn-helix domain-containing protein [Rummeliibacillus pycnus]|uniref:helix-turn-helix domain-containing protein n=1 Tax=Rummeliibacillus pycnus TaxID=101070 RepID=UPI000C9B9B2D|nr:helix-turn-helix domain-containing protein [Rummeliibacillus pycnus]